ncbi:vWA domain-containing protein [Rhizobium sp. 'Codium 1']|uniref:vWA domain-containing protein n=1 Tax=Rhizobium sp. 'Codium 1' TaxID=2940484 RepID=UPI002B4BC17A|nr:VWA domain-containing protein [Rhizobium sp. 'Codium 1']
MKSALLKVASLLAGVLLVQIPTGQAEEAPRTIIVMDGSGSMWGQIDGRPKLEIAREAVADVVTRLPVEQELGLIAYGHRSKGNCGDIELLVPPGKNTGQTVVGAVNSMRFLGKTPLSAAVRQAAEALRYGEESATVVLVTDGLETCEADPCALASELEASGVDFTAHVVGFGLSKEEGAQVACLAENTGGRYIQASNTADLTDALTQTVGAQQSAPQPAPVTMPDATLSAPSTAAIATTIDVDWTGPGNAEDYLEIVPATTNEVVSGSRNYAYAREGAPARLLVPANEGDYLVRYIWNGPEGRRVLATAPLAVSDAEFAVFLPEGPIQMGSTISVRWKGPNGPGDYLAIRETGNAEAGDLNYAYTKDANPAEMVVPNVPGDYELLYIVEGSGERRPGVSVPLKIVEGEVSLQAAPFVRPGATLAVRWKGPGSSLDYLDIVPSNHTEPSGELTYAYIGGAGPGPRELGAPTEPGNYLIRYLSEGAGGRRVLASIPLAVDPNAPDISAITTVEATFEVPADFAGTAIQWSAVPLPGQAVSPEAWAMNDFATGPVTEQFEPGTYAVRGDAADVVFTGEVSIVPGGENRFVILPDETQSPAGAVDGAPPKRGSDNIGEDTGYLCDGPAPCPITDSSTGLSFMLPAGWWTDYPTTEGYTSGAQAADDVFSPRVNFFRTGTDDVLVLGPRQWVAMNGPCEEVGALGPFCMFQSTDPQVLAAYQLVKATLKWDPPQDRASLDRGCADDDGHGPDACENGMEAGAKAFSDYPHRCLPGDRTVPNCDMRDGATNLSFHLLENWVAQVEPSSPFPRAEFAQLAGSAHSIWLNPKDWPLADRGCFLTRVGQLCLDPDSVDEALDGARQTLQYTLTTGEVLRRCGDEECDFSHPNPALSGKLPALWSVEVGRPLQDGRISTWFWDRDPAGNFKLIGLNQWGGDNCLEAGAGQMLCEFTPYISTDEFDLIRENLKAGAPATSGPRTLAPAEFERALSIVRGN